MLACIGVTVFEMLMTGILGFCGSSIASYGVSICSLIFLCLSIAVNALLFVASLLNWRQQMQIEQTLKGEKLTFVSRFQVLFPVPTKSPYPTHLYPIHQLGMNWSKLEIVHQIIWTWNYCGHHFTFQISIFYFIAFSYCADGNSSFSLNDVLTA